MTFASGDFRGDCNHSRVQASKERLNIVGTGGIKQHGTLPRSESDKTGRNATRGLRQQGSREMRLLRFAVGEENKKRLSCSLTGALFEEFR